MCSRMLCGLVVKELGLVGLHGGFVTGPYGILVKWL